MSVRVKGGVLAWEWEVGVGGGQHWSSSIAGPGTWPPALTTAHFLHSSTTAGTVHPPSHPPDPTFSSQKQGLLCPTPSPPPTSHPHLPTLWPNSAI